MSDTATRPRLRLRTVGAKLTTLVALSVIVSLVSLPLLARALQRQMVHLAAERVDDGERTLSQDLDDDLADLASVARAVAIDWDGHGDVDELARAFVDRYPDDVIILRDDRGRPVEAFDRHGPTHALENIPGTPPSLRAQTSIGDGSCGSAFRGVVLRAWQPGRRGGVEACIRVDARRLQDEASHLGIELALDAGDAPVTTAKFPSTWATHHRGNGPELFREGDGWWVVGAVAVAPTLQASQGTLNVIVASDVTATYVALRREFALTFGALIAIGVFALAIGVRLARVMSSALRRVIDGHKRLARQDYARVEHVRTGDELEDLATGFNAMVDGLKERDELRTTFGKYMTPAIVDHVMSGRIALGGVTLKATILFTDIRDFTSLTERMDPHALVALLNDYFTAMVEIVIAEGGVVDKYIGDAMMAVFGAPLPGPDDAHHAVRAALKMRRALVALNTTLAARGVGPIRTGIGIHTGEVVAGNIGSDQRMEYTVIGDVVNVAARLESMTKEVGVDVLVSEATYHEVAEHAQARRIGDIAVKGRGERVVVYELVALKDESRADP